MAVLPILAHFSLFLTASVLFVAAFTDLKNYKIPNELIVVLAGLYFLHAIASGSWVQMHWNLGFALVMFTLMTFAYAQNLMGGGDLKLLTVAFLWVGLSCAMWFALLMTLFAGVHTALAHFGWVGSQVVDGRKRIAFGPTVAAALIGTMMLGCL